jgi:hypothetical protein
MYLSAVVGDSLASLSSPPVTGMRKNAKILLLFGVSIRNVGLLVMAADCDWSQLRDL